MTNPIATALRMAHTIFVFALSLTKNAKIPLAARIEIPIIKGLEKSRKYGIVIFATSEHVRRNINDAMETTVIFFIKKLLCVSLKNSGKLGSILYARLLYYSKHSLLNGRFGDEEHSCDILGGVAEGCKLGYFSFS